MFLHVTILSINKDLYYRKIYMRERKRERERERERERGGGGEREINFKKDEILKSLIAPLLYC